MSFNFWWYLCKANIFFFWIFNSSCIATLPSCSQLELLLLFLYIFSAFHLVSLILLPSFTKLSLRSPTLHLFSFLLFFFALHLFLRRSACPRSFSSAFLASSTFIFFSPARLPSLFRLFRCPFYILLYPRFS